ncbi:Helix-turn-helix domain-containing protein [Bradyrhizobium yuanmingense]|uniref:Helix-turn-helix domain-containing protein n=1 Tax=Bradyrhizobium yuanmingense TaxID=108015 RepID=A0A1C3XI84_9BRAD|nr:UDP-N-acetylglucosamine 1-carboxyvinyltransferase [Bradyrhizobium yuanmingense]SCB51786.1 Helix-turn-helix domain-containing protein [Bradyrhizobium yuanmingense]
MIQLFLREWREHRGLTQQQLAERSGIALPNLSKIELGQMRWHSEMLEQLALAFDLDDPRRLLFPPA